MKNRCALTTGGWSRFWEHGLALAWFAAVFAITTCGGCGGGSANGSTPPAVTAPNTPLSPVTYGAQADQGETDDPLLDAATYAAGTSYSIGQMVVSGGHYYVSESDDNAGNSLSDKSKWWGPAAAFLYVDPFGSDANTYNADPSIAKQNPVAGLTRVNDCLTGNGAFGDKITCPPYTLVLFKRGASWEGVIQINQQNVADPEGESGSNHGRYYLGAYGNRTDGRPLIRFKEDMTQSKKQVIWANRPGLRVRNLRVDGQHINMYTMTAGTGLLAAGDVIYSADESISGWIVYIDSTTVISVAMTPNRGAAFATSSVVHTTGSAKTATIDANTGYITGIGNSTFNWKVLNSESYNLTNHGFLMGNGTAGSSDNVLLENSIIHDSCKINYAGGGIDGGSVSGSFRALHNTVYDNGNGNLSHNIYLSDGTNVEVAYNHVYRTSTTYGNSGLVVHGVAAHYRVHHNHFDGNDTGLAANDGHASDESFEDMQYYSNIISNSASQSVELACNTNSSFLNNIVYGNVGAFSVISKRNSGGADATTTNLEVAYNTFSNNGPVSLIGAELAGIRIRNNIFRNSDASKRIITKRAAVPDAQLTIDRNLVFAANVTGPFYWNTDTTGTNYVNGTGAGSLFQFNGLNSNSVTTDPLFTNPGLFDFTLQGTSPAKLSGTPIGIATDFKGVSRSPAAPTMGAYE
jgi:hypothetical protein